MRASEVLQGLTEFGGLPVYDFPGEANPAAGAQPVDWSVLPQDVENHAWRVSLGWSGHKASILTRFQEFFRRVDAGRVRALVAGPWMALDEPDRSSAELVEVLAEAADKLPALYALFLGDIVPEYAEISWIQQSDVTQLLLVLPQLEELGIKGSCGLALSPVTHENLRWLSIRTGGLGGEVVRAIGESSFPRLRTLELCLGDGEYGGDTTVDDLADILSGERLPELRHLAISDGQNTDAIAAAVARAPIVAQLETLDLSLGDLGDEGVRALLAGQPLDHLTALELNHNYVTEPVAAQLRAHLPTVAVNLDRDGAVIRESGRRYVAVSE